MDPVGFVVYSPDLLWFYDLFLEMVRSVLLSGLFFTWRSILIEGVLLFSLLAALILPGTARAQAENLPISLTAAAGFDGYCRDGHWIPVRVRIENRGAGTQGQVEVSVAGANNREVIYAREVSLPSVSHKELTLYVYPEGYLSDLTVRLVSDGDEILHSTIPVDCVSSTDSLYGVLADSISPFNILSEIDPLNGSARVAKLGPLDIPGEAQGLEALDVLVISNIDTGQFSPAQKEAVSGWVAGGGRLIVAGGPNWRKSTAGLLDLLPLQPQQARTLNSDSTPASSPEGSVEPIMLPGELLVTTGTLKDRVTPLLSQSGLPLAASGRLGYGEVIFLAFDPSLEPLRSWDGLEALYRLLLDDPVGKPAWASGFQDWLLAANAVSTLPSLRLPSVWWVAGFLGLYVVAIGPVNFILLRRLKKRELAWISIPVLVIIFSSLAFLVGRSLSGREPVLNHLAVVQVWPGAGQAKVDGLLGVFSPGRDEYQLEISPQFLAHSIPGNFSNSAAASMSFLKTELGSTRLPDLRVDVGEIRSLAVEGQVAAYPISQDLAFHVDDHGAVMKGSITNQGNQLLQGAVLLAPGKSQHYGDFSPGQTLEIGFSLDAASKAAYSGGTAAGFGPVRSGAPSSSWDVLLGTTAFDRDRQTYQRYTLLNALTGFGPLGSPEDGLILAAWSSSSPVSADLGTRDFLSSSTTLYLITLQPQTSLSSGRLSLPPGLFTWSILTPGSIGEASPYDTVVNPGGFSLRFQSLIPFQNRTVESLTLRLKSYGATGRAGVAVQLWNFSTSGWDGLPGLKWGETSIPTPESYVGPGGEIRLRLDNQESFGPVQVESADFILAIED